MTVGDIKSQERGSGARFNAGKPPIELIPFRVLADYFRLYDGSAPAGCIEALDALGRWQEGGTVADLVAAAAALGDGWGECAEVFDYGRRKYSEWNWAKGMAWSIPLACAGRHILKMIGGELVDEESGKAHRGHAFCNITMLMSYVRIFPEGDDRPAKWFAMTAKAPLEPA